MPRGYRNNPFCLYDGSVRAPAVKVGDWIEVLAAPSADESGKSIGQKLSVFRAFPNSSLYAQSKNNRTFLFLDWTKGDRWQLTDEPKS